MCGGHFLPSCVWGVRGPRPAGFGRHAGEIGVGLAARRRENPRLSLDHRRPGCPDMNSLKGHLLIATPQLHSPIFSRSVILMLDHGEDGAMGVILNNPLNVMVTDLSG